ncbi:MAG: SLC13 family permease [Chlamydiota bacterium]|jgi:di/tricarboxylate transporter
MIIAQQLLTFGWQEYLVISLLVLTIIALIKEYFPIEITLFIAGIIPVILGIVPTDKFFYSIANETVVTIAMLFIVAKAFETSGLIHIISKRLLPKGKNHAQSLFFLLSPVGALSAFLNNTPIVMILVPIIRKWALEKKLSPSLFLIPVSFAAMLGGTCTLIGTSTNLVINGLLQAANPAFGLSFFEIGKIGFFCALAGLLFLIFFSKYLLPVRVDPDLALPEEMKKMMSQFRILPGSSLIGKSIKEIGQNILKGSFSILEITRGSNKIEAPRAHITIQENDIITFLGDLNQIAALHAIEGLESVADPKFNLDKLASHYFEYTITANSSLVGKTLKRVNFRIRYGGSVFAIYRQGSYHIGNISERPLRAGDILMVLSSKEHDEKEFVSNRDIYTLSPSKEIPLFSKKKSFAVALIMIGMVVLATGYTSMMIASIIAAVSLILFRVVTPRKAFEAINWNLLVMIIGGLTLSKALEVTNVAKYIAHIFLPLLGKNPYIFVATTFICTTIFTELITNTAAVLILFPIFFTGLSLITIPSLDIVHALAITVAIAGSCSFLTPIGYQTNTIVFGPGGYKYTDYFKIGLPLNLIILILCTFLIPIIWGIS